MGGGSREVSGQLPGGGIAGGILAASGLDGGGGAVLRSLHDACLDRVMRRLVTRMGGMENAQRVEPVRMVHGEAAGNHAAEREAEDGGSCDAEMIEQVNELFREDGEGWPLRRQAAVAMAVEVEGDDAEVP
mgnify:CR=1 FL=1